VSWHKDDGYKLAQGGVRKHGRQLAHEHDRQRAHKHGRQLAHEDARSRYTHTLARRLLTRTDGHMRALGLSHDSHVLHRPFAH
jgi:hypothetical protein